MKKNTSCSSHSKCPPGLSCDKAKAKRVDCEAEGYYPYHHLDVPVILSEVHLQALVEADIHLPTPAKEVKFIKKNISLKQCEAFKSPYGHKVKVFITGVVHKNVVYVEACSGNLKDYHVDIPFTCSDAVDVWHYVDQYPSQKSSLTAEFKYLDKSNHGSDRCRDGAYTKEYFNEPIECKLVYSDIFELDLYKNHDRFGRFTKITEKMDVNLWFKLLQTQQTNGYYPYKKGSKPADATESSDNYEPTIIDRINDQRR
ncbi:CsxC family protein [Thalassobacillus hwangdonensis]|uniref:CsxC family protein n=1 Tax=Thalassobacillus hwangdonensis TaxID=546108 RepID=A0ABW3KX51_9BACI